MIEQYFLNDFNATAGVVAFLDYLYLHGDVGFHLVHMTDDTHMTAALAVEGAKSGDGIGERLTIECSKTFVDEECIHRQCVANVGMGKGKRYKKTLFLLKKCKPSSL